jgi:biopolymer transport protein ExbB/TolQ
VPHSQSTSEAAAARGGHHRSQQQSEFLFSTFALIITAILIHALYVVHIRPRGDSILAEQNARMRVEPSYVPERSLYIVVHEYEPEVCIILMIWSLILLGHRAIDNREQRKLLASGLLHVPPGMRILPKDTREYARQMEALDPKVQQLLLPRAIVASLERFGSTANIHDASEAGQTVCESEAERLDSELSMVRYTVWAIPAIGFVGTVRGIGAALQQAHQAVSGNISGVTEALGVTFNATFTALTSSIIVMFFLHQLQLAQERMVLDTQTYLDQHLLRHMRAH